MFNKLKHEWTGWRVKLMERRPNSPRFAVIFLEKRLRTFKRNIMYTLRQSEVGATPDLNATDPFFLAATKEA
jgi:hypothetical protein